MKKLKKRLELPWSDREGGFWLRFRGIKLYEEIERIYLKRYGKKKALNLQRDLDGAIDEWDNFIYKHRIKFVQTTAFEKWKNNVFKRDKNKCKDCKGSHLKHPTTFMSSSEESLQVHKVISLSEQIARYIKENGCNIHDISVAKLPYAYQNDNGITLCIQCYDLNDMWGDGQVDMHRLYITGKLREQANKQKEWFKLASIQGEIKKKLKDSNISKEWFIKRLGEIRRLRNELASSSHEPGGANRLFEIQVLFRIGEYDLARRLASRQERYWRRQNEVRIKQGIRKKEIENFAIRNRETIIMKTIDKLIERYRKRDYSIVYTVPEAYEAEDFENLFRESENETRKEMGIPLIGEGWIAETEVFNMTKDILPEYEVMHHARPKWLERQEFDIYVPALKLAIEYMGEQHYRPLEYFGGEESYKKQIKMDKKKLKRAKQKNVRILYIKYDANIDKDKLKQNIEQIMNDL